MTIALTGTGGLFTRIGRFGKIAQDMRIYQGTTLPADVLSLMAQYQSTRLTDVSDVPAAQVTSQASVEGIMATLVADAQKTLIGMVFDDKPTAANTLASSMQEVISQMKTAAASVKQQTVTATAAAFATPVANAGNGTMVVSTKRGDGLVQENLFAEAEYVICTSDSFSGGTPVGQEQFTYTGAPAQPDVWSNLYPAGSGGSQTITAVDASQYQQGGIGNYLKNGDMETFTTPNIPDNWAVLVGTAGTDFAKDTGTVFDGAADLKFIGGTAVLSSLAQQFNNAAGTTIALQPDTAYVVNFWIKADVVPASGVLTVDLVDGTNTVINDDQAVANSLAITLSGITTSYVAKNAFFRTPRSLPSAVKLRVRISTVIPGGTNIFFDRLAFTQGVLLYTGGPYGAIFSGQTTAKFVGPAGGLNAYPDGFTLTTTQDYGGASNLSTFQQLFERLFGMRAMGLLLPSSGAPTVADSLIST